MHTAEHSTYLKFTSLVNTVFWDYYSLSNKNNIDSKYPLVRLEKVLNQRKGFITIDDARIYKLCRVQVQGKGVILRTEMVGKSIKTKKQQICKADDFLVAEIDAKVGGFGIVPKELEGAIVSGHYFLFEIDTTKLLPKYLGMVVTHSDFMKQIKSTGSTNYAAIRPYHVLDYQIPLPTLVEQERLVSNYEKKINQAETLYQLANDLENEIEHFLFEMLGIKVNDVIEKNNKLQVTQFADTGRWDTLFLLGKIHALKSKYILVDFSEVIKNFNKDRNNKSLRINSSKHPNQEFRYIGMEHVEKGTGHLLDMPIVKGKEIKSQTIQVPNNFIVFGKLRPYLNKYWVNYTTFDNIICSSEFFVFDIDEGINKSFFKQILSSKIIQDQISDKTSGARMPRINENIFFNLQFPLPPIETQNSIASKIELLEKKIYKSRVGASNLKIDAARDFEKTIFSK